jgi:outer membrane murein-binding lipoprotein Lpp
MQHRKAVTLDTKMWPWDNPRVDKLEKDVNGIRSDVSDIKDSVDRLTGVKNVGDNGDRDVDEDNTQDTPQNDVVNNVLEKDGELTKLRTEIVHDKQEIGDATERFDKEMHELSLKHAAALHQMNARVEEKENHANSLMEDIRTSTEVHSTIMKGVSSAASQYCVNLTR